jgi:hypothetical protein
VSGRNMNRFAPLTGVVFVVLVLVVFILEGETPDVDDSAREVVDFYGDHEGQTFFASVILTLASLVLIFFAATLRRALRYGEGAGVLSMAAFGGGLVAATGFATDAALRFALADSADEIDPAAAQALNALFGDFFFPMVAGLSALILATSLAALRTRLVPAWLAWVGVLIVVVFFTPLGFVAFLASGLWIAVASVLLWRREESEGSSVAPSAT